VRYEVHGTLRDVVICHCQECRRWHGHLCATTAARAEELAIFGEDQLRWISSPDSDTHGRRAFCTECGSSMFWRAPGLETISIAAGTLDPPTGVRVSSHWYVSKKGDYYELPDDGLPRHERRGA
jgi:hypothetical protein